MIGRKFRYKGSMFKSDEYDRVIKSYWLDGGGNKLKSIVSSNGVVFRIDEIEIEPLWELRDNKLNDLGI